MDEKTVTMMEGVAREWRVRVMDSAGNVLNPEGFSFYGAAADGVQVPRRMQVRVEGDVVVLVLPGLWMSGRCWRYQVLCQDVLTGVEWVLCQGDVVLERRVACNGPALHEDAVLVDAVLDSEAMVMEVVLGDSTAASAEAARLAVAARAGAEAAAERVAADVVQVEDLKRVTLDEAAGAALSAERAEDSKRGAEAAAVDAAAAAQLAEVAAAEAEASREAAEADAKLAGARAAEADASAKVAADAVSDALAARDETVAARGGAEECERVAALRAGEAEDFADAAVLARAGAEAAMGRAETAQVKAEKSADEAEQKAALLGDAALKGADNTFTGLNTFSALTQFPAGASFEKGIPWFAATTMAFGVPPLAAYAETWKEYRQLSDIDSITSGQSVCIFAPCLNADSGEYFNTSRFSRDAFFVSGRMVNFCHAKRIRAVTFSDTHYAMVNPYRCEDIQLLHVGKASGILIWWNHNLFSKAPDLNIYAPNLTVVTTGVLIQSLNSVGTARIKLPSFNNNFTLKIGAMQKDDVLYLLQNLPTLKTGVSRTAAISCDPALETDEEFLAQVAAFYAADTKTGWIVALTFQGNAIDAAVATYSLRRMTPPIFAMREECSGGAYVSADGKRWAIFSGSWVAAADCGYTEFPNLEAALAEWGLTEYVPDESLTETK